MFILIRRTAPVSTLDSSSYRLLTHGLDQQKFMITMPSDMGVELQCEEETVDERT